MEPADRTPTEIDSHRRGVGRHERSLCIRSRPCTSAVPGSRAGTRTLLALRGSPRTTMPNAPCCACSMRRRRSTRSDRITRADLRREVGAVDRVARRGPPAARGEQPRIPAAGRSRTCSTSCRADTRRRTGQRSPFRLHGVGGGAGRRRGAAAPRGPGARDRARPPPGRARGRAGPRARRRSTASSEGSQREPRADPAIPAALASGVATAARSAADAYERLAEVLELELRPRVERAGRGRPRPSMPCVAPFPRRDRRPR